jgi:acylpyruvate hydrolase
VRLISYRDATGARTGALDGTTVTPLAGLGPIGPETGSKQVAAALRERDKSVPLSSVTLLPASPTPRKVFCVGLNYLAHVEEAKRDLPEYPVLFPKFASNLIAATEPIRLPPESQQVDYEGELAVIIGTRGRRVREEDALQHVLGFTLANDVTMRDYQYKTHQWVQGKAWDGGTPLGPSIVSPDAVDLASARICTILNGQVVQQASLRQLIFTVPRLIATITEFTELEPGDVILAGTPGGVGYRRDPQLFLKPGDEITVEVDGVGALTSEVKSE